MVNVTPRAKTVLKQALAANVTEPGVGLRLDVSEQGQIEIYPDREKQGDQVVEHEGDVVLLIGEEVTEPLDGATIDCTQTAEGAQLVISREAPAPEPRDGIGPS